MNDNMNKLFWMAIALVAVLMMTLWYSWVSDKKVNTRLDQLIEERRVSIQHTKAIVDSMRVRDIQSIKNEDTIKQLLRNIQ